MSKPTTYQILKTVVKARKVIAKKKHWTIGDEAETKDGSSTDPTDSEAYSFCAIGAVHKIVGSSHGKLYKKTIKALDKTVREIWGKDYGSVMSLNDGSENHKKVIKAFDRTINNLASK